MVHSTELLHTDLGGPVIFGGAGVGLTCQSSNHKHEFDAERVVVYDYNLSPVTLISLERSGYLWGFSSKSG
jgi:hypothetical protein